MPEAPLPSVGTRFSQGPWRGTIRFVGEVAGTQGVWLGVEWDDASRGKHDGINAGHRYFVCRTPGSGSFIRPTAKLAYGTSFLQALKAKYISSTDLPPVDAGVPGRKYTRKNLADIEIEAPNMGDVARRVARLTKLRDAGLGGWRVERNLDVNGAAAKAKEADPDSAESFAEVARAFDEDSEQPGDIEKTCPNIRWLDLSRSLIPTWQDLALVAQELKHLETLLLHFNRFAPLPSPAPRWSAFEKVTDLRLDGTLIDWNEMLLLAPSFPALELLQLAFNNLRSLQAKSTPAGSSSEQVFTKLRVLNLEANELSEWSDIIDAVSSLPSLERLILSANKLSRITSPSPTHARPAFPSLQHVSLSDNPITSWSDLEALDAWVNFGTDDVVRSGLQSLTIGGEACSLVAGIEPRDFRALSIARLGSLTTLNGGTIRPEERKDAERYYVSRVRDETVGLSEEEREKMHPRWKVLAELHGVAPAAPPSKDKGTLQSKLIEYMLHLSSTAPTTTPPHLASLKSTQVKLLPTTPLRLCKSKLARSLGLPTPRSIEAIWALLSASSSGEEEEAQKEADAAQERIAFELDDESKELAWYQLKQGDELVVVAQV